MQLLFVLVAASIAVIGLTACIIRALLIKFDALWRDDEQ